MQQNVMYKTGDYAKTKQELYECKTDLRRCFANIQKYTLMALQAQAAGQNERAASCAASITCCKAKIDSKQKEIARLANLADVLYVSRLNEMAQRGQHEYSFAEQNSAGLYQKLC